MIKIIQNASVRLSLLLLLLLSIAFYDVVFLNKTFKVTTANSQALPTGTYGQQDNKPRFIPVNGTDTPVMEEPSLAFIKHSLQRGTFPLWNPHQACGFPFIGMIEVGFFYPLNFIMYLLPDIYAWDILILARFFFAGLFIFWFMQLFRFRFIPSLTAAIVFMFTGPLVVFQYWTANVDILIPLVCLAYERFLRRTDASGIALLAFVTGFTVIAGHPEHIFLVNIFGFFFFLHRLFAYRRTVDLKKIFGGVSIAYALGFGLSAVVFFPFIRNLLSEFWSAHPAKVGLLLEEHRDRALSILLPHFFQAVPLTYKFEFAGWWGGYIGVLPVALSFLSLFARQKRGLNYFLAGFVFLLVSKQYALPYINWIGNLPLFNQCRYASHTPMLVAFCVAVLAGMGARYLLHPKARHLFKKGGVFAAILLILIGIHLNAPAATKNFMQAWKASLFAVGIISSFQIFLWLKDRRFLKASVIATLLPLIVFLELFAYIHREHPRRFDSFGSVPYIKFLKSSSERIRSYGNFWAFYPDTASGFDVDDLGYFFGLVPKRYVHFVNTLIIPHHFRNDLRPPSLRAIPIPDRDSLLDLLNVHYLITPADDMFQKQFSHFEDPAARFPKVYHKEVKIYKRPSAYPRAFVVHRAVFETDGQKSMTLLAQLKDANRQVAVINAPQQPRLIETLRDVPATDGSLATILRYSPNEIQLTVRMENPGFLILADAYHPDWKAFVNGRETTIFQTDYLLRSVFLPTGKHRVRFVFQPLSFYLGAIISLLSAVLIALLHLNFRFPGRKG